MFGHIVNFAVIIFWPLSSGLFSDFHFPCATGQGLTYAAVLSIRKMCNLSVTPPCMSSGTRRSKPTAAHFVVDTFRHGCFTV